MRILTARLVLRPLRRPDLRAFVAYRSDPAVARYQPWEVPFPEDEAAKMFVTADAALPLVPGEWRQIAIARRSDNVLLGDCGVLPSEDGRQAELGITLAAAHWRQGYAKEALSALITELFTTGDLHRVTTDVDPRNEASAALMRAVGMRQEAHFRQSLWCKGEWTDEVWFAALRSDWPAAATG